MSIFKDPPEIFEKLLVGPTRSSPKMAKLSSLSRLEIAQIAGGNLALKMRPKMLQTTGHVISRLEFRMTDRQKCLFSTILEEILANPSASKNDPDWKLVAAHLFPIVSAFFYFL